MDQNEDEERLRREKILWVAKLMAYMAFIAVMMIPIYIFREQSKIGSEFSVHIQKMLQATSESMEQYTSEPEDYYHYDDSSD